MIFLLLSALLVTQAFAIESRPPGCKDPVYACQDLTTARSCGVVSDCIHDIWSTMRAPNDNNEICDLCKEMVKEARDQLLSNETQEEIKEVFEGSCELLEIKFIVDECKKIFDDLIPEIIEMLASRMDPNMVCTVAGLCNNAMLKDFTVKDKLSLLGLIPSAIKNGVCDGCKTLFSSAKHLVTTIPQDEMQSIILHFCQQYPSIYDECDAYTSSYLPAVYNYVLHMDPTTTCVSIGVCTEKNEVGKISLKYGDNLTCEFCESLVQHLREVILSNSTKEEFRTALLNMCSLMGDFSAECKQLVNDYFDMIYDFLDKNLDPKKVCTALGLCQSSKTNTMPIVKITPILNMWKGKHPDRKDTIPLIKTEKANPDTIAAVRVVPAKQISKKNYNIKENSNEIGDEPVQQLPIERMEHPLLTLTRDTDCAFSKAIMFFLEKDLKARNTKAITTALDNVCNTWMPGYMKECENFVHGNYMKIVELLVHGVPFNEVSGYLGLCPESKLIEVKVMSPVHTNNDISCDLCMQVMNYLKEELKDKKTEEEIKAALDKVCTYLPQSLSQECQQFVNQYTDTIVSLLLQQIDPSEVCHAIGLCPTAKMVSPVKANNGIICDVCTQAMDFLKKELQDKKTEEEIREALDKVCSYLPQSFSQDCQQFINRYADTIVSLLLQDIDPSEICALIGLCSKVSTSVKNDFECDLCKEIMAYVKAKLSEPKVEDDIRRLLDEVCSILPKSWATECEKFVDQYTNLIITLLLEEVDPDDVCSALGFCSSNVTAIKPAENYVAITQPLKSSVDCEICTSIMNFLENELKDKTVESDIRQALDTVCSILPQSYAVKCQQFVDKYTEKIITFLVQNVDPSMVCSLLHECPSQNIECTLCEYALHFLQKQLMTNTTEAEIKQIVKELCSYLPKDIAVQCDAFIDEYGDALIVLIAQQLDPSIICPLIKVCPSKSLPKELPAAPLRNVKQDGCDICKTVVNYIDKLLEEDDVDEELTDLAAKVCSVLSGSSEQECISIVHIYGPYILRMIGKLEDGQQLCQSIDLCPRIPGHVHLLGAKKCSYGPSYWCKSRAHAAACKAEMYCKQKVWKN